ncbi:glycosyltransferase family 4 protein [Halomonas sp. MA07-2]|uniref:glycosyltransferase family 4 protein n=1 Tax=unclassified Halomonas TaxID=2609666 RepID=UPI003EEA8A29
MRICLVSETWAPEINGVAHTLGHLSREAAARGHRLQLVRPKPVIPAPPRSDGMEAEMRVRGVSLPGYREVRLGLPAARRLNQFWREQRPDVIYLATQGPLGWSAQGVARRLGIPCVAGWHTNFDHYCHDYGVPWLSGPVRRRMRTFHNRSQATLVPTHQQADELTADGFRGVRVMARGIDGERFSPAHRDSELRRQWGAGEHTPVILHVGRLAPEKNLSLLRESCVALSEARPDARLVIVGDGPGRRALAASLPYAHFTGFIPADDLARHYASADLFLFPSLSETWGNVLLEAMASGLATVAFRHAAGAELIDDDHNGLALAVDDANGFREAAVTLCQQPARRARLGRQARQRAIAYGWPAIADTFLDTLDHARETPHGHTRPRPA